ncbi:MAG: hypothetical protein HY862_05550 [Chloroflexi bacterium]|nr:hypothetical protein [Chloroflexota bacterium]
MSKKISLYILAGIILFGFAVGGYGVYRYVDAELKLRDNEAEKLISSGKQVEVDSFNMGYELFKSSLERDELRKQRADALPFMGVGMVVIAVGWLGYEIFPKKNQKADPTDTQTMEILENGKNP